MVSGPSWKVSAPEMGLASWTGLLGSIGPGGRGPGDGDFVPGRWWLVHSFNRLDFFRTVSDL